MNMTKTIRLSRDRRILLERLLRQGVGIDSISRQHGFNVLTIRAMAHQLGIEMRTNYRPKNKDALQEQVDRIVMSGAPINMDAFSEPKRVIERMAKKARAKIVHQCQAEILASSRKAVVGKYENKVIEYACRNISRSNPEYFYDRVKTLRNAGMSDDDISGSLGLSHEMRKRYVENVKPRRNIHTAKRVRQCLEYMSNGHSKAEALKKFSVSESTFGWYTLLPDFRYFGAEDHAIRDDGKLRVNTGGKPRIIEQQSWLSSIMPA